MWLRRGRHIKSILVLVPADGEPSAFRNFQGEFTKQEMFDAACRWLDATPGGIVMYDDEELTPEVKDEEDPDEQGFMVDGLYVPKFMLHAPRGGIKYGQRRSNA